MKQFYFCLFTVACFFSGGFLHAQSTIPNVLVDPSAANAECTLIINPKNSNQVLGAEIPDLIYRSSDAGLTWTKTHLTPFASTQISWDVALAADTAGHYFYQAMDPNNLFHTLRSDDYGLTWGTESSFGNSGCYEDKSWMTVDRSPASVYNGRIYSAWTLRYASGCDTAGYFFINHSSDNGISWSNRDTLAIDPSFVPQIGGGLSVGPSGQIGVTWCGGNPNKIRFKKSSDGGITWTSSAITVNNSVQPSNDYAAFIDHSVGATSAFTSLAYDISGGAYNGNLYCVWDDLRNGTNNADIFLAKSTDDGLTWSTQRINDDTSVRNQILPAVAVDPTTGWVYVSYLDARLNTDNFDDTLNYYLAWSEDGGQTFQNVKVSNQANTLNYLHSDYMGLDANFGVAHMLWVSGTSSTGQQTWTAAASQNLLDGIKNENQFSNSSFVFYPALPNPAIDFTTFDFLIPENSKITLTISDLNGKTLAVPINEMQYEKGRHQFCVNHHSYNLSPGIYIATISTSKEMLSRKFEVLN